MKRVTILAVFVLALFASGSAYAASTFHATSGNAVSHGGGPVPDGGL